MSKVNVSSVSQIIRRISANDGIIGFAANEDEGASIMGLGSRILSLN